MAMQELDKRSMGKRIRQIRLAAGLRQWELARMLGTTQSAVHKYEHGVVPEPRRLVELARVGRTSIEWVLTGRHWENGSEHQQRLSNDVLEIASVLREIGEDKRARVDEALRIVREALRALETDEGASRGEAAHALRELGGETLELLECAWRIQRSVLRRLAQDAAERLSAESAAASDGEAAPATEQD